MSEFGRADTLRVVEAGLAPPAWMGPVAAAGATEAERKDVDPVLQNYGKLLEDGDLADVVFVVGGQRFLAYRGVLAARSEYFRGLFKSGMQDGGTREVCYEDVSAAAFRALLRFLYTGELPAWGDEARGEGGPGGRQIGRGWLRVCLVTACCCCCVAGSACSCRRGVRVVW